MYIILMIFSFISKNICRSSTLSTAMELYGRSGLDWMFSGRRILTIILLLIYYYCFMQGRGKGGGGKEPEEVLQPKEKRLSLVHCYKLS